MKKFFAVVLALALVFTLVACGGQKGFGKEVSLKVWGSQEDQTMLGEMIASFKALYPDTTWNIELGVVSEADAKARYSEDPAAAADVFAFAHDQLGDLVAAGALYEIAGNYKTTVTSENVEGSVEAATMDGKLYAFPMTADNGYFMYYDSSVFSAEDVKSLDKMLEVAGTAGKKVFMDLSNGWYIASFFLGAGCSVVKNADGTVTCDFNNEKGLAAAEAIKAFAANSAFVTGDDNVLKGGMGSSIAAGVSGTWNASAIKEVLGKNYAACKLPTCTINGAQVQMASFGGYKLVGVNKVTAAPEAAMALAAYLTNEANQVKRFETRELGPSNIKAATSEAVLANVALKALADQSAFSVAQKNVPDNYWAPAEAFGALMENKDYKDDLQTQLNAMVAQILA